MKTCNETLSPLEMTVRDALLRVVDPEIGENIVDLGLVYGLEVEGETARVNLTMTTPACPMGSMVMDEARTELIRALPGNMQVDVQLVWEPPWEPSMISAAAKHRLGWDYPF
ncbi:MAG TPA: metal-sulfur cluster assembly factor [Novimethylophilus sp.]|jgi:metal-sulfur cluster biosynthetic enzyme|uniref:metal-sulfur cluster assembly factor n=1 Tax=Novimethylophilus sp. TaxID=2137426 RepID=UPI002F3FEC8D